ncbi:hypothetical protein PQX77_016318 [Marasmius sp. AFHP31]|nr:hypothetical protein PQX77_016318 [Marasmius sp. AFHP31]
MSNSQTKLSKLLQLICLKRTTGIDDLPNELLIRIFKLHLEMSGCEYIAGHPHTTRSYCRLPPPFQIASVCDRWRKLIVDGLPELWASFNISAHSDFNDFDLDAIRVPVRLALERTIPKKPTETTSVEEVEEDLRKQPLSITTLSLQNSEPLLADLFEKHDERLVELRIGGGSWNKIPLWQERETPFSNLVTLACLLPSGPLHGSNNTVVAGMFPKLRHLTVGGIGFHYVALTPQAFSFIPWCQLWTLSIDFSPHITNFYDILSTCPNIRSLKVRLRVDDDLDDDLVDIIQGEHIDRLQLPHLISLEVNIGNKISLTMVKALSIILDDLVCPNLASLSITGDPYSPFYPCNIIQDDSEEPYFEFVDALTNFLRAEDTINELEQLRIDFITALTGNQTCRLTWLFHDMKLLRSLTFYDNLIYDGSCAFIPWIERRHGANALKPNPIEADFSCVLGRTNLDAVAADKSLPNLRDLKIVLYRPSSMEPHNAQMKMIRLFHRFTMDHAGDLQGSFHSAVLEFLPRFPSNGPVRRLPLGALDETRRIQQLREIDSARRTVVKVIIEGWDVVEDDVTSCFALVRAISWEWRRRTVRKHLFMVGICILFAVLMAADRFLVALHKGSLAIRRGMGYSKAKGAHSNAA